MDSYAIIDVSIVFSDIDYPFPMLNILFHSGDPVYTSVVSPCSS
jgi:hypothetical protein